MMLYLAIPLTIVCYYFALQLHKRSGLALFNPILVCIIMLIALLLAFDLDEHAYQRGTLLFGYLLEPAVIALAFPLYQQFVHVRAKIVPILVSCAAGVVVGLIVTTVTAIVCAASPEIVASLAPKAVTTPIAMAISKNLGGIPAISAVVVILVGIFGNVAAPILLKVLHINSSEAQGLALGAGSHVLGTSKAMEMSHSHGAFSTTALLISAVLTAVIAPLLYPLLVNMML